MANTYIQIGSTVTVGAGGSATISFTSIPGTYTDLLVRISARSASSTLGTDGLLLEINGSASNFSNKQLAGDGSFPSSASRTSNYIGALLDNAGATSNTFSSTDIYIPNYTSTTVSKSFSVDSAAENNATSAEVDLNANLWNPGTQAAITSLTFKTITANNFVQYSTASLYGIKNS
jgi:hypothetical protein